jgi:hypothetical protein
MVHRNPFQEGQSRINFVDEQLVKTNTPINDYNRCMYLLNSGGIVYESLNAIKLGFDENMHDKMHFIDYNDLVNYPEKTMEDIYDFLGETSMIFWVKIIMSTSLILYLMFIEKMTSTLMDLLICMKFILN